ncbi:MAG: YgiQ family radical SAM protein [Firmicutes bacterium]|nr:YgiQ family radical SAM protein [Bacillota bacterium]
MAFLPISRADIEQRGWDYVDFVYVSGDAYVDHPSFGVAIISRVLEAKGYRVAILPQPNVNDIEEFRQFGKPRLAYLVTAGNIDSMVAHYTAAKKKRSEDSFSPGGKPGKRPDRAVTVYSKLCRRAYADVPIIIGGLEASLRRFANYDYWDDEVKPSVLIESGADILAFGMGEYSMMEIAERLNSGEDISTINDVRGTCVAIPVEEYVPSSVAECPSYERVCESKREYAISCRIEQDEQDAVRGKKVIQRHGDKILVQNPPMRPITTEDFDWVYELPYERAYHPSYEAEGGVPAIKEVEFSIIHNRGCFGACAFCSLAFHQGRQISTRSIDSVVREAEMLTKKPNFKGYIHDVGGPTANFRIHSCKKQDKAGMCKGGKRCLAPEPCPALQVDHSEFLEMLRRIRAIKGVKRVFIRSGIRFDYMILEKDPEVMRELVEYHVSGQLKVAPEHCSTQVLDKMGKPHFEVYKKFANKFYKITEEVGKKQYLVPYLMSSHPGSTINDAIELSLFLKKEHLHPEQVQDFYPTPGTISTCIFYTGLDPYTLEKVYVPRTPQEKALQRALLQYFRPENHDIVEQALIKAGRTDLIGSTPNCLIKPSQKYRQAASQSNKNSRQASGRNSRKSPIRNKTPKRGKKK